MCQIYEEKSSNFQPDPAFFNYALRIVNNYKKPCNGIYRKLLAQFYLKLLITQFSRQSFRLY
jgi:hypothetical protein